MKILSAKSLVLVLLILTSETESNQAVSDMIEKLLNSSRYNSRTRPASERGSPNLPSFVHFKSKVNPSTSNLTEQPGKCTVVDRFRGRKRGIGGASWMLVSMYKYDLFDIGQEYSMTLYLRQVWKDERLDYSKSGYNKSITLNHNQFDRLWSPDVFIRNLKAGVFHVITVPNRLIRLSPDGTVLYSQRLSLTLACDMILDKYPMDNQTCKIEFGSYAYTTEDLMFYWRTDAKPVEMSPTISLPEYTITGVTHVICSKNISSTGSFPCLRAHFHLDRRLRAYILTIYLPSFLVVLLSWLSFWIDMESAPARTSLSILTVLTITTQSSGLLRSVPAGSFTKAIDVWMATCLVFVFGAFIEYSVVNTLARSEKQKRQKMKHLRQISVYARPSVTCRCPVCASQDESILTNGLSEDGLLQQQLPFYPRASPQGSKHSEERGTSENGQHGLRRDSTYYNYHMACWADRSRNKAVLVEVTSRALFPLSFLLFNIIYWPMYLL